MTTNDRRKLPEISDIPPEEINSTVSLLLEIRQQQQEENKALRDEIARLKGGKPKPPIKP